jgi:hypothetical protein
VAEAIVLLYESRRQLALRGIEVFRRWIVEVPRKDLVLAVCLDLSSSENRRDCLPQA